MVYLNVWLFCFVTRSNCIMYQLLEHSQRNHTFLMILQIFCLLANTFNFIQSHPSLIVHLNLAILR